MSLLIEDCPRCGSKRITFDVLSAVFRQQQYGWKNWYEAFCLCRGCHAPTIFLISMTIEGHQVHDLLHDAKSVVAYKDALNKLFVVERYISLRDHSSYEPPEFLNDSLSSAFSEGAACFSIACYNAAATMFRLCIDLATRPFLPEVSDGVAKQPNEKTRRDLGLRLQWLFANKLLDPSLQELASCIREDANDGAHQGNLSKEDAEDILDFTYALLDRLVTEPNRLKQAELRRAERRKPKS